MEFLNSLYIRLCRLFVKPKPGRRFIILLGGPGAGKGTLASGLVSQLNLPHINVGNLIRREIELQTPFGKKYGPYVDAGKLMPDGAATELLRQQLRKSEYARGAIIDGSPRTEYQARLMERLFARNGLGIEAALFLDVSEDDLVERLSGRRTCSNSDCARSYHIKFMPPCVSDVCDVCQSPLVQRKDQAPGAIRTRLSEYNRTAGPLKRYYERLGLLKVVQANNEDGPERALQAALVALKH